MHWTKISIKKKKELEELKMTYKTSPLYKKSPKSIHDTRNTDTISRKTYSRKTGSIIRGHSDQDDNS
jgi:hypothetical protein